MASINALRALLVGGAVIAGIVAAFFGMWLTVAIMTVAVLVHGVLTLWLRSHPAPPPTASPPAAPAPRASTDLL